MVGVEYLGGLPQRQDAAPVEVTVDRRALHLKHGGFLRGWSYQLPLASIASVELTTAREVRARGILSPRSAALLGQAREDLLAIDASPGASTVSVILRGPWAELEHLRQEILKARMRAAKQWRS